MNLTLRMVLAVLVCVFFFLYAKHQETASMWVGGAAFVILLLMLFTQPKRPTKGKGN